MRCPVCQLELGIEHRDGELVLQYDLEAWKIRCPGRDRGDPVLCSGLMPTILKLLKEAQATLAGIGGPVRDKTSTC